MGNSLSPRLSQMGELIITKNMYKIKLEKWEISSTFLPPPRRSPSLAAATLDGGLLGCFDHVLLLLLLIGQSSFAGHFHGRLLLELLTLLLAEVGQEGWVEEIGGAPTCWQCWSIPA